MRILFVDKVFLKARRAEPMRGVEVFNLVLLGDLMRLGYEVDVTTVASWHSEIRSAAPRLVRVPDTGIGFLTALQVAGKRSLPTCDVLLLGNVGKILIPLIRMLRGRHIFQRCVLVAHREPTPRWKRFAACPRIYGLGACCIWLRSIVLPRFPNRISVPIPGCRSRKCPHGFVWSTERFAHRYLEN